MRRTSVWLAGLLATQLALAIGLAVRGRDEQVGTPVRLLTFDTASVDALTVEAAGQAPVHLSKADGRWILPDLANAPADSAHVASVITALEGLKGSWPVASTSEAARRFKVADDSFERRIEILAADKILASILVGSSPSFHLANLRVDGQKAIYALPFDTYEVGDKPEDWVDKSLLRLSAADIVRIDLTDVTLLRDKDSWRAADLAAGEEMVPDKVAALERAAASPMYRSILGKDAKPEDGFATLAATVTLTLKDGRTLRYDLGKRAKGDDYALRVSGQPFLFELPAYAAADLVGANRAVLVRRKGESGGTAKGNPSAATSGG